jgi:hypothetical protein
LATSARRHSAHRAAGALLVAAIILARTQAASAESPGDYLAAGFQSILKTSVPGLFNGCTRGTPYAFADGTRFICSQTQRGFAIRPKVQLLVSADRTLNVLLIGDRAYAGGVQAFRAGLPANPILTATDALAAPAAPASGMPIATVRAVAAIGPLVPIRDIAQMRLDNMQNRIDIPGSASASAPSAAASNGVAHSGAKPD